MSALYLPCSTAKSRCRDFGIGARVAFASSYCYEQFVSYEKFVYATCRFGAASVIVIAITACDEVYGVGELRGAPTAGSPGAGAGSDVVAKPSGGAGGVPSNSSRNNANPPNTLVGLAGSASGGSPSSMTSGRTAPNGSTSGMIGGGGSSIVSVGGSSGVIGGAPSSNASTHTGGNPGTTLASNPAGGSLGTTRAGTELDEFGIQRLYPTLESGKQWHANWGAPARSFNDKDPNDEWIDVRQGNARYVVDGDGTLKITGEWPRLDVRDPHLANQWRDVEMTIYLQRIQDEDTSWSGILSVARTNHGIVGAVGESQNLCDTRGLGVRFRYDGRTEFVKETSHFVLGTKGAFADLTTIALRSAWDGGIPYKQWLGYKHVVYDLPDGSVKQELWLDQAAGAGGGTWVKFNEYVDVGGVFGKGGSPCAEGIDPTMPLTNRPSRQGSESGLPNITVYFQSGQTGTNGLWYKWASVREIVAPKQ